MKPVVRLLNRSILNGLGAGIGGHMAARLLFILERLIEQKLKKVAS